jgi:hypothetical protein
MEYGSDFEKFLLWGGIPSCPTKCAEKHLGDCKVYLLPFKTAKYNTLEIPTVIGTPGQMAPHIKDSYQLT